MNKLNLLGILSLLAIITGCAMSVGPSGKASSAYAERAEVTRAPTADETDLSNVRLVVNGESTTAERLWKDLPTDVLQRIPSLPPGEYQAQVAEHAVQLIRHKIDELVLYQTAKLRLPDGAEDKINNYVDAEIRKIVTRDFEGRQRRYERSLEQQGRTIDEIREQFRREIIVSTYLESDIKPRIEAPTRAELWNAFQTHIDRWRRPTTREMALIDIRIIDHLPEGVTEATRAQQQEALAEARALASKAWEELRAGASFGEVASRYSDGLHADDGGIWGEVSVADVRERFVPAVEALADLAEGAYTEPIETADGFFIVKCHKLIPGVEPDFVSVQPELGEIYHRAMFNQLVNERVAELREKATIEPADLDTFYRALLAAAPPPSFARAQ